MNTATCFSSKQRSYMFLEAINPQVFISCFLANLPCLSSQDEVNQIMETNLWLRHVSDVHVSSFMSCLQIICFTVNYVKT